MVSATTQLKLLAPDGKKRLADMLDSEGVTALAKNFPNNRAKGGYRFVYARHLKSTLQQIDATPQSTLMLKKHLRKCVDWSKIKKENYMNAMIISTVDSSVLKQ